MEILRQQYELVKSARKVLLDYCEELTIEQLVTALPAFNNSSMRHLLVHIAYTYRFWLGCFGLHQHHQFPKRDTVKSLQEIKAIFEQVNEIVEEFLARFDPNEKIMGKTAGSKIEIAVTSLQLFTHAITHEFHHKGQILSMSRHFGFIPVDTDALRTG